MITLTPCLFSFNNSNRQRNSTVKPAGITFTARPEYDNLNRTGVLRSSSYFRRGSTFNVQNENFADVENVFKTLLKENKKQSFLLVGVGKAQEIYSYLTSYKSIAGGAKIASLVDVKSVDLQPKMSKIELIESSYLNEKPLFAQSSFYKLPSLPDGTPRYKVCNDVCDFVSDTFNNPKKAIWNKKIEEVAPSLAKNSLNLVSINNTLDYLPGYMARKGVLESLCSALKLNGFLITDTKDKKYKKLFECLQDFENVAPGIWRKLR